LPQNKTFILIFAAEKTGNLTDIIKYVDRAKPIVRKCLDDKTLSGVAVADLYSGGKLYETPSRLTILFTPLRLNFWRMPREVTHILTDSERPEVK